MNVANARIDWPFERNEPGEHQLAIRIEQQSPGPRQFYLSLAVVSILLVDSHRNRRSEDAMTSLTPDTTVRELRGLYQRRNGQWLEVAYGIYLLDVLKRRWRALSTNR